MKSGRSIIMNLILLFSVISTTIIYASFNTKLQINGDAMLRVGEDIRITGIERVEYTNGAYENYNSKYSKDTISIYVTLPVNSSITYEVEITNKSTTVNYEVDKIEFLSNDNSNIIVESNLNKWDNINKNSNKKFYITLKNNTSSEQEILLVNHYEFSEISSPILMSFYDTCYDARGNGKACQNETKFLAAEYRPKIKEIFFQTVLSIDEVVPNENAVVWWNLDDADKGKIIGYLVENEENKTMYDLYIVGYNKIIGNAKSGYLFANLTNLEKFNNLDTLDTSSVTSMNFMFEGLRSLKTLDISNLNLKNVSSMVRAFADCSMLESFDIGALKDNTKIYNFNGIFSGCKRLKMLDLSKLDTSSSTNMMFMFSGCESLEKIYISNFNTSKVTSMSYMFQGCNSLTDLDVSSFDTSKVTDMSLMFANCISLKELDVSHFITKNVEKMRDMFYNLRVTNLDVSSFDTSKVTDMHAMFANCGYLTILDVSNFDTSRVTDMENMFGACLKLTSLDLSKFNTSKVTNMKTMFKANENLTKIYVGDNWNTSNVAESDDMFSGCIKLTGAISYNWQLQNDLSFPNYTNGYLTYKAKTV